MDAETFRKLKTLAPWALTEAAAEREAERHAGLVARWTEAIERWLPDQRTAISLPPRRDDRASWEFRVEVVWRDRAFGQAQLMPDLAFDDEVSDPIERMAEIAAIGYLRARAAKRKDAT